jgi:hypothetical protein
MTMFATMLAEPDAAPDRGGILRFRGGNVSPAAAAGELGRWLGRFAPSHRHC